MKPRPTNSFKDLWLWQRGVAFSLEIFTLTNHVVANDKSGVVMPLRRAVISIPVKIARGYSTGRPGAYVRSLLFAYGATQEIETHLHLAVETGLVSAAALERVRVSNDEISQTIFNTLNTFPYAQEFES